jgi:hypothetical protein
MGNICIHKNLSFVLINIGETFQREMDIAFIGLIGVCVVVYLDDVIVFSKDKKYHIAYLRRVFNRCRKYGISLNPPQKKIRFVDEGRLLGFIVSKHGMRIEPERAEAIAKIPPPHKKNDAILGKINFVRRFVSLKQ